jgi:hypothetical protein
VYPEAPFLSSMLPSQSLSMYQVGLKYFEVEYLIPKYFVPFTYLKILFHAFQCDSFEFSVNLETRCIPYIMSCIVIVKYIRICTSILNTVGSTLGLLSSFLSFIPVMTDIGVSFEFKY